MSSEVPEFAIPKVPISASAVEFADLQGGVVRLGLASCPADPTAGTSDERDTTVQLKSAVISWSSREVISATWLTPLTGAVLSRCR
jgi:hypothetical protein